MHIDSYSFGSMTVDGKEYKEDLIVFKDKIKSNWWRREGHRVSLEDIEDVIEEKPDVLVLGTGYHGLVKVSKEVVERLRELGIELVAKPTKEACEEFNKLSKSKKVVAALHLTC